MYFEVLNKKLEEGYKMTDQNCEDCKHIILFNTNTNKGYCCFCKLDKDFELTKKEETINDMKEELNYKKLEEERNNNSNLLGTYLLKGWRMLDKYCEKCLNPLMDKNKKLMCVVCNIDMNEPKKPQEKKKDKEEIKEKIIIEEPIITIDKNKEKNSNDKNYNFLKLKLNLENSKIQLMENINNLFENYSEKNMKKIDHLMKYNEKLTEDLKVLLNK